MADTLITGTTLVEKESRSIGDVPIGGIVAWAKSLSGVPNLAEGWVECDGTTLIDALSPLNGQTIPNLNGNNQFMRGNSTSGGTGGVATNTVARLDVSGPLDTSITLGNTVYEDEGTGILKVATDTGSDSGTKVKKDVIDFDQRPPFYDVVWIMRIR